MRETEIKLRNKLDSYDSDFKKKEIKNYNLQEYLGIAEDKETIKIEEEISLITKQISLKNKEKEIINLPQPEIIKTSGFEFKQEKLEQFLQKSLQNLHKDSKDKVDNHILQNTSGNRDDAISFFKTGLSLLNDKDNCPFCAQSLLLESSGIIEIYQKYFDENYIKQQKELKSEYITFCNWNISILLNSFRTYLDDYTKYINDWLVHLKYENKQEYLNKCLKNIKDNLTDEIIDKISNEKRSIENEINKKISNLEYNFQLSLLSNFLDNLTRVKTIIDKYNSEALLIKNEIANFLKSLDASNLNSLHKNQERLSEIKKRLSPAEKEWCKEYKEITESLRTTKKEREDQQLELKNDTLTLLNSHENEMNITLGELGADFKIVNLEGKSDNRSKVSSLVEFGLEIKNESISLKSNDNSKPHFNNTLSEGDKATLAFSFFLSYLLKQQGLSESIVVFDDPLSSLDDNRRLNTTDKLVEISKKIQQTIILTHKKDFLFLLADRFNIKDRKILTIKSNKKGSCLSSLNVEKLRKHEQHKLIDKLDEYQKDEDSIVESSVIQGDIRKVFENALWFKYYYKLPEDKPETLSAILNELRTKNVINDIIDDLFDLCTLSSSQHHGEIGENPLHDLSKEELIPKVQKTLILLEKI